MKTKILIFSFLWLFATGAVASVQNPVNLDSTLTSSPSVEQFSHTSTLNELSDDSEVSLNLIGDLPDPPVKKKLTVGDVFEWLFRFIDMLLSHWFCHNAEPIVAV